MTLDVQLLIPHLSKELNLIGYPQLPYTVEKVGKSKNEVFKVAFDNKTMIESLLNICFDLVNNIKTFEVNDNPEIDKLKFENSRLQVSKEKIFEVLHKKQLELNSLENKKKIKELTCLKLNNSNLEEKISNLEKKIKELEASKQKLVERNKKNENMFEHFLKKKDNEIFNLHTAIWKQFNLADKNYFPKNFELIQLNQVDFSKLWTTVNLFDSGTKVGALQKAVCIFQKNNKSLMEENFSLKTLLLTSLQKIHETIKHMALNFRLPKSVFSSVEMTDIFINIQELNIPVYNTTLNKHLNVIIKVSNLFTKAHFMVCDNMFVCWSKIIEEL